MNLPLSFLPLEPELSFLGAGSLRSIVRVDSGLVCVGLEIWRSVVGCWEM